MDGLNQFIISRVLGSTMKKGRRSSFGPLGALSVQNQVLALCPKRDEQISYLPPAEKLIVRAFEEKRQGLPLDRVLADPTHTEGFLKRCRDFEVVGPDHAIILRLLQIRKSPREHVRIEKATKREPRRDFSNYLYAAEMASVRIKYQFGASIDDILAHPGIGKEFDKLASQLRPGLKPLDYRLAALHVRKSHYFKKDERSLFEATDVSRADQAVKNFGPLDRIDPHSLGHADGIFALVDKARGSRFLYLAETNNVEQAVRPFIEQELFGTLANSFWSPSLSSIELLLYNNQEMYHNASKTFWAKRLVYEKAPIFNAPIRLAA